MKCESSSNSGIDTRLESAIVELLALQEVLSKDEVDGRVLTDFRHALNQVRNTAWATQKFLVAQLSDQEPAGMTSFLAAERIRAAYQMCKAVVEDLQRSEIEFQKGQLCELERMVSLLSRHLKKRLGPDATV